MLKFESVYKLSSIAACAALVCACGGGGDSSVTATPTPTPTPTITAPAITTPPAAVSATTGTPATFSVVASGSTPLTYQWLRDGTAIAGATSASYTIAAPALGDNGARFSVVVSNSAGSATSAAAVLSVADAVVPPTPLAVVVQPQSVATLDATSATFSIAVTGSDPVSYRWQLNGVDIAGATANTYTTPVLTLADSGGKYGVIASNAAGTLTSATATLTVNPVPAAIATAPQAIAVAAGQSATFSAQATGSAPLTYQWQKDGSAIGGATSASYTTPATTVADSGAVYRVVVTNAGGSATSAGATLSVQAVAVAPAIASAPASVTVIEGQTATFTASATGTAPLAYQWLRNGTAIGGATAASFTTAALTVAADNAAKYSVRVSNSVSTAVSAEAVLTVQAATSPLIGRAWTAGLPLETDDNAIVGRQMVIDDAGRATVVFLKSNGTRNVLYATRGTPNAAGAAPTWSTPVAIDVLNGVAVDSMDKFDFPFLASASPNGNVVVSWLHKTPCTATTYATINSCRIIYTARFLASTGAWEAPVAVGDFPQDPGTLLINDRGDVALGPIGWVRTTSFPYYSARTGAAWRAAGSAAFKAQALETGASGAQLAMDAAGNLLLGANFSQNATTDIVAWRGTLADGFAAKQVLDTLGNAATLKGMAVGTGGQQLVTWSQNNGTVSTVFAAAAKTPTEAFAVKDLGELGVFALSSYRSLVVNDAGQAILSDRGNSRRLRWNAGTWGAAEALPSGLGFFESCDVVRTGDHLCATGFGNWATYDATRNVFVQPRVTTSPGSGYILGVSKSSNYGFVLSVGGTAAMTLFDAYDVLPTATNPAGDGRSVNNLWGAYLK